ncbi:hypothetical protein HHI36_016498 [Cryptolaemus montrouzieri]|uniref:Rhodanese domain-containing protein n=1 Tax=Cryptolaemus montrouzieri TaxID=559131 RepID=A0ABD2NKS4_9CUCU
MLYVTRLFRTSITNMRSSLVSSFQDVKSAIKNENILVVDVREPEELKETGEIPGSINIPVGNLENVFKNLSNEQFKSTYGKNKPEYSTEIILSCRSGKRSEMTQQILQKLGYCNVYNYSGGWLDWEKNQQN